MGKKDDTKVSGVSSTSRTKSVQQTEAVSGVDAVKPASGVGRVERAGSVRRRGVTRVMSLAEREELFRIINEEAEKMFAEAEMSQEKKQVVASAVKMAIDIGLVEEEPLNDKAQKGKKR